MRIDLNNSFSLTIGNGSIGDVTDRVALKINSDWDGLELGLTSKQARELATELNKLADEVEEKFYIKVLKDNIGDMFVLKKGDLVTLGYKSDELFKIGYRNQFTQAEIDANSELKKFDSDAFKVRVEGEK